VELSGTVCCTLVALLLASTLYAGETAGATALPLRGAVSNQPAKTWEWAMLSGNGSIPETVNNCLAFAWKGTLDLLPALPDAMPKGCLRGILVRGQMKIDRLQWDKPAGAVQLDLTSGAAQTVTLRLPQAAAIQSLKVARGAATVKDSPRGPNCREVSLPKGETVSLAVRF